MAHSYVNALFHCVFSTKERRPAITPEMQDRLWGYIGGIARENSIKVLAAGGATDHVHLLLSIPSTIPVAKAIQLLKGGSSKWIHEAIPGMQRFAWQVRIRSLQPWRFSNLKHNCLYSQSSSPP